MNAATELVDGNSIVALLRGRLDPATIKHIGLAEHYADHQPENATDHKSRTDDARVLLHSFGDRVSLRSELARGSRSAASCTAEPAAGFVGHLFSPFG